MKKLLLMVAMVAGVLVVKAQDTDTKDQDVSSAKNTENRSTNSDVDESKSTEREGATSENVPAKAKETLKSKYPEAKNVEWSKEGNNHEAEFTVGESEYSVLFDNTGKWKSTKVDNMAMNEVPTKVKDGIKKGEYKDWTIKEVDFIDSPEKSNYKVELKNGMKEDEVTVDKSGTIIKKGKYATEGKSGTKSTEHSKSKSTM